MRLKTFSIFGLSFLVMFTLTSCDNENLVNEEELNFSDENPTLIVLAEQKAGNDGYDEKGFSIVNCPNSLELHKLYSGLKLNFQLSGVTRIELESVDGYALSELLASNGTRRDSRLSAKRKMPVPFWFSMLPMKTVSLREKTTLFSPCLATSTEDTGFPFTRTDWLPTILECIRL